MVYFSKSVLQANQCNDKRSLFNACFIHDLSQLCRVFGNSSDRSGVKPFWMFYSIKSFDLEMRILNCGGGSKNTFKGAVFSEIGRKLAWSLVLPFL